MIKVAAYCRVSTDKDDQANSFESQQRYFREYIDRQPDWELVDVYADEGITGTSTKKRTAFNRMINDAYQGRIQIIVTKEISRFSRNIVDTLTYTRELKQLGVGVRFIIDGIDTMDPESEMLLGIMSAIAQEESRKISSRVKWGQTRQMERGVVFGPSLLGYDAKGGQLTVNPEGAELVRLIFHKYGVEKKGTTVIARELREAGYKTSHGNANWTNSRIIKILRNEKYVGDLVQKKSITPNYLTHDKKINRGEEALVCLEDHHEAIIDRELWNLVQSEIARRDRHEETGQGHSNRYALSGKLKCGECGSSLISRKRVRKDGSVNKYWCCYTATNEGKRHQDFWGNQMGCDLGKVFPDELGLNIVQQALDALHMDFTGVTRNLTNLVMKALEMDQVVNFEEPARLENKLAQMQDKKRQIMGEFCADQITQEQMMSFLELFDTEIASLQAQLDAVQAERRKTKDLASHRTGMKRNIEAILKGKKGQDVFYRNLLEQMVVYRDNRVELRLNHLPQEFHFNLEPCKGKNHYPKRKSPAAQ